MKASLYIHVPFCAQRCDYCAFYSVAGNLSEEIAHKYVDNILDDVYKKILIEGVNCLNTLYIGGGTPTLLGAKYIKKLFDGLLSFSSELPNEITLEANPESFDADMHNYITHTSFAANTRISFGIQTLNNTIRKSIGRIGFAETCINTIQRIKQDGFTGTISVDLIAGLPGQGIKDIEQDIEILTQLGVSHVSLYSLILEESSPLFCKIRSGHVILPTEDYADTIWLAGRDFLLKHGFKQYEVSNFAFSGYESQHNLVYWNMGRWLAAGPSASATIHKGADTAVRTTCAPDLQAYLSGKATEYSESLSRDVCIQEYLLMGFRLSTGPNVQEFFNRFGSYPEDLLPKTLSKWRNKGLICTDRLALTSDGLLILNRFLLDCMEELDFNDRKN